MTTSREFPKRNRIAEQLLGDIEVDELHDGDIHDDALHDDALHDDELHDDALDAELAEAALSREALTQIFDIPADFHRKTERDVRTTLLERSLPHILFDQLTCGLRAFVCIFDTNESEKQS